MSAKLHIGHLPRTMDSIELGQLFEEYGTVCQAEVITHDDTRQSRGFGYVKMSCEEEALRAMRALDGTRCLGQTLSIQQAEPTQDELPETSGPQPGGFGDRSGIQATWGRLS